MCLSWNSKLSLPMCEEAIHAYMEELKVAFLLFFLKEKMNCVLHGGRNLIFVLNCVTRVGGVGLYLTERRRISVYLLELS